MPGWTVRWSWSCRLPARWSGNRPQETTRWVSDTSHLSRVHHLLQRTHGGVDRGDQLRGYYSCRTKSRKFYKYIFTFLLDVAITNAFILMKHYCPTCPFANIKSFRLQLAKELMAEYCSRRRWGRGGNVIRPLPYRHFPITMEDEKNAPRKRKGRCALHSASHVRATSTW